MMKIDITPELMFKTARSGGKGGQNVNKVETMVECRWQVYASALVNAFQKQIIQSHLLNRITGDGFLLVKSQSARTQLGNKEIAIQKINELVNKALLPKKARIATKIPKNIKEKRLENKKLNSSLKQTRKKFKGNDY